MHSSQDLKKMFGCRKCQVSCSKTNLRIVLLFSYFISVPNLWQISYSQTFFEESNHHYVQLRRFQQLLITDQFSWKLFMKYNASDHLHKYIAEFEDFFHDQKKLIKG